jgi:hypothetical protein
LQGNTTRQGLWKIYEFAAKCNVENYPLAGELVVFLKITAGFLPAGLLLEHLDGVAVLQPH